MNNPITQHTKSIEVLLFTRHLATLLKAGIPVADSLSTLANQTKNRSFKMIVEHILKEVENGQPLGKTLAAYPDYFSDFYISLIDISEQSGSLDENLHFIAKQLQKNYSLQQKLQNASLYPSLIFLSALVMGGFISYFVLPQLTTFFDSFQTELPPTTQLLLFFAYIFKEHGVTIAIVLAASFTAFQLALRSTTFRYYWHALLLSMPLVRTIIIDAQMAQMTRNIGILLKSGLPLHKALSVTTRTLSNLVFRKHLNGIREMLNKGISMSSAIEKGSYTEFPSLVSKMIAVGEKTGNLDESMLYLGDFYEEEIENASKNLMTLLEPALLLGIGLGVGFLALAVITPIYELTGSISR